VRAVKNRFGAVSELGVVFEMKSTGLRPVPTRRTVSLRASAKSTGLCGAVFGRRIAADISVEVQALVSSSSYGTARRDGERHRSTASVALARGAREARGLNLVGDDVFVNIAGGMTVDEPASDLGVLAAIASSVRQSGDSGDHANVRPRSASPARFAASRRRRFGYGGSANGVPALHHARGQRRADAKLEGECELIGVRTVGESPRYPPFLGPRVSEGPPATSADIW